MSTSIGVDVGGTFTDLVALSGDGSMQTRKVLSTPKDQSIGVIGALEALGMPMNIARFVHGTTVVTNLLLERTGARVVLCATRGATDLLELRRQDRAALYDLSRHHPEPLLPAERVVGVDERVTPQGIRLALSTEEMRRVSERVAALGPDAVAISLLHAPLDPRHEAMLAGCLRATLGKVPVIISTAILPEIREYERTATAVAEAYARPRVADYLRALREKLAGFTDCELSVMSSNGGVRHASEAVAAAASMALSGPAGGVVGAAYIARRAGIESALTIDIGGTSADAGLIVHGSPLTEPGGSVAGIPISLPRVLVETVSAGGGSIGWQDEGGALRVGPRSAGAVPGPAAFGRGGELPTVTDAHVVLGHIPPSDIAGAIRLDPKLARDALAPLAASLSASIPQVAKAMISIANAGMARALKRVSVERGIDPSALTLIAFGGGGPLHACDLAEMLGMRSVLVPPAAGVLSALGLAIAAERRESMVSVMRTTRELGAAELRRILDELSARAGEGMHREFWLRARYVGQGHEIDVPLHAGEDGGTAAARFAELHQERIGFTLPMDVEVISARHAASGDPWPADLRNTAHARNTKREVSGPASLALEDATLLVRERWIARETDLGGWLLEA